MGEFVVRGVAGMPEIGPDDDLAALIAARVDLADGDIVAVTSKIVSKAEGRARKGADRETVIDEETARVVAEWTTPRGRTRIAQTHHGFVLAAAGVDESNVQPGTIVPLPTDPDGSARRLRAGLRDRTGTSVGVVVTDTAGRPWRDGQVDFAIGAAGVMVRDDLRGRHDSYGNELGVTVVAVADELAAATELVRRKLDGMPVAVVRGLGHLVTAEDGPGAAALVRPAEEDRFRLGTPEAMQQAVHSRYDVVDFTREPVDRAAVEVAVSAALTAPTLTAATHAAPTHAAPTLADRTHAAPTLADRTHAAPTLADRMLTAAKRTAAPPASDLADGPRRGYPWRFVLVESGARRLAMCDAMQAAWVDDLRADGLDECAIADRIADRIAGGHVLRDAPLLIVPCLVAGPARIEPDERRAGAEHRTAAERASATLSAGAAIENLLVSLSASGLGTYWSPAPLYCLDEVRAALDLPAGWEPMGVVAVGHAAAMPQEHPAPPEIDDFVAYR